MKNDAEFARELATTIHLFADFSIFEARFRIVFQRDANGVLIVKGSWINDDVVFAFRQLTNYFDVILPEFFNFELFIEEISLMYKNRDDSGIVIESETNQAKESILSFAAKIKKYGKLSLNSWVETQINKRAYEMKLQFEPKLYLKQIPIIGQFCDEDDGFKFEELMLEYIPQNHVTLAFISDLTIKGIHLPINPQYTKKLSTKLMNTSPAQTIYWLDLDKSFSVLYLSRVGVMLDGSGDATRLYLFLDASFTIAKVRFDFYELYISTSMNDIKDISFGLSGLMVTLKTPTFSISGGLYKARDQQLYNGALSLVIGKYGLDAIGSYGELPGSNEKSFFAYCMISMPLGGHPAFFITGFAFGFGINRSIVLPELKGVPSFPLVSAAMGTNKELKPDSKPDFVLSTLSDYITPTAGQYFVSAGVKFLTFGILESFALLNIEFGNSTKVSLLGVSTATIPPLVEPDQSIAFVELALKATFDPAAGEMLIAGALTNRSYLFHPNCKLTGGFAVGFWYSGKYSGDFIVSVGGVHHPKFNNIHYPDIPKIGISWIINSNISVVGGGYFALTPSCIMAGLNIALTFEMGNLKAWLSAGAEFIMSWKPFFYDAEAYASIGASYTLKILWVRTTFKIELGARLHIWGPEFSGEVYISWFIISFTISFGAGKPNVKDIDWNDFVLSFIPDGEGKDKHLLKENGNNGLIPANVNKLTIETGLIMQVTEDGNVIDVVNGYSLQFNLESTVPFSNILFNDIKILESEPKFGIAPMGEKNVDIEQKITLTRQSSIEEITFHIGQENNTNEILISPIYKNAPAALWGNSKANMNAEMLNLPFGVSIKANKQIATKHLLPSTGQYDENALTAHEEIKVDFRYTVPPQPPAVDYPNNPDEIIEIFEKTITKNDVQTKTLERLHELYGTNKEMKLVLLNQRPKSILFAVPQLQALGS